MKNELLNYEKLVKFLNDALNDRYEITLIDANDIHHELENTSTMNILVDILNSNELKKRDYLCSYSKSQNDVFGEKKSIFYIKDDNENIVGFLNVQEKETSQVSVKEVLNQVLGEEDESKLSYTSKKVSKEVDALIIERIETIWKKHKEGKSKLSKEERLNFMRDILEAGILRMKGSMIFVSKVTGISQATLYRYLSVVIEE